MPGVSGLRGRVLDQHRLHPALRQGAKGREGLFGEAPRNWGKKNVTLISSITLEGMGASMSIEKGSPTRSPSGFT